jgi:hypothetical protein
VDDEQLPVPDERVATHSAAGKLEEVIVTLSEPEENDDGVMETVKVTVLPYTEEDGGATLRVRALGATEMVSVPVCDEPEVAAGNGVTRDVVRVMVDPTVADAVKEPVRRIWNCGVEETEGLVVKVTTFPDVLKVAEPCVDDVAPRLVTIVAGVVVRLREYPVAGLGPTLLRTMVKLKLELMGVED